MFFVKPSSPKETLKSQISNEKNNTDKSKPINPVVVQLAVIQSSGGAPPPPPGPGPPPPPPPPPISEALIESLGRTDPLADLKRELDSRPDDQRPRRSGPKLTQDVVESLKMLTPTSSGVNLRPSDVFRLLSKSKSDLSDEPNEAPHRVHRNLPENEEKKSEPDDPKSVAEARNWIYGPSKSILKKRVTIRSPQVSPDPETSRFFAKVI